MVRFGLLLLMEFAYNNAPSVTPTVTLFYANKGYHLNLTIHPERDLASFCYGLLQCYPARYSRNLEGLEGSEMKGFWTVASV